LRHHVRGAWFDMYTTVHYFIKMTKIVTNLSIY
jgi:hypothetical protein